MTTSVVDMTQRRRKIEKKQPDNTKGQSLEFWPAQVSNSWQEQMVLRYAPLIKYIASRLALRLPSHISLDDLISSGIIGLIDAIHKFDPGKNISFKTYAEFRVKGAILDELRSLDWIPRSVRKKTHLIENAYAELQKTLGRPAEPEEVAEALGLDMEEYYQLLDETKSVSLIELEGVWKAISGATDPGENDVPDVLADENVRNPFMALQSSLLREVMVKGLEALPNKEKLLISLYYYEELTMKEIGEIMGYTESRISQLHTQAMLRLRGRLRKYFHPDEETGDWNTFRGKPILIHHARNRRRPKPPGDSEIALSNNGEQKKKGGGLEKPRSDEVLRKIEELSNCSTFLQFLKLINEHGIEPKFVVSRANQLLSQLEVEILWLYYPQNKKAEESATSLQMPLKNMHNTRRRAIWKILFYN